VDLHFVGLRGFAVQGVEELDIPPRERLWEDERMTLDDRILTMRLRVMRRVQELQSVALACRERHLAHAVLWLAKTLRPVRFGGTASSRATRAALDGRRQLAPYTERLILGVALAWPM
jgi:hypothetical protein